MEKSYKNAVGLVAMVTPIAKVAYQHKKNVTTAFKVGADGSFSLDVTIFREFKEGDLDNFSITIYDFYDEGIIMSKYKLIIQLLSTPALLREYFEMGIPGRRVAEDEFIQKEMTDDGI